MFGRSASAFCCFSLIMPVPFTHAHAFHFFPLFALLLVSVSDATRRLHIEAVIDNLCQSKDKHTQQPIWRTNVKLSGYLFIPIL
jgi:hypothetical protein